MNLEALYRNWGWILARGIAAIAFGVLAFFMPAITLAVLVALFGVYALVDGVSNVVAAVKSRSRDPLWWALLLGGLVGIGAGLGTLFFPGLTAVALLFVIAGWAIITGVFQIVAAIRLRREITGEGWLILGGLLSVAFGVLIAMRPGAGALALVFWIGAYAILFGCLLVALAFRLRGMAEGGGRAQAPRPRVAPTG